MLQQYFNHTFGGEKIIVGTYHDIGEVAVFEDTGGSTKKPRQSMTTEVFCFPLKYYHPRKDTKPSRKEFNEIFVLIGGKLLSSMKIH